MIRLRPILGRKSVRESEVVTSSICLLKTTPEMILILQLPLSCNLNKIRILRLLYSQVKLLALTRLLVPTKLLAQIKLLVIIKKPRLNPTHSPKRAPVRIQSMGLSVLENVNPMTSQLKSKNL